MKTKTAELTGKTLDWAVAKCENLEIHTLEKGMKVAVRSGEWEPWWVFTPTSSWAQGGPIIEREKLSVGTRHTNDEIYWGADVLCWARNPIGGFLKYGPTPLVAAMRCFIASKLGDEVDVPEELL